MGRRQIWPSTLSCRCGSNLGGELIPAVLESLQVENFRCISSAQLDLGAPLTIFTGGNGAGKTSYLEAIYALGLARSFRTADNRVMILTGAAHAQIVGRAATPAGPVTLGIDIAAGGMSLRAGGREALSAAALAEILPVQAIHAEIGGLVQGPPEARRRLLDWGVFHVEHGFLSDWRAFRRALQQRNALLRSGAADELFPAWDQAMATAAAAVDGHRRRYLAKLEPAFSRIGHRLLGAPVGLNYTRGWPADSDLLATLATSRDGDRAMGHTRCGPSRADLQFEINETRSRWRASKGQQKLLAAAVILAQLELLAQASQRSGVLLVDEPAADLDADHLAELMASIGESQSQVFVAAITAEGLPLPSAAALFHVEHGRAKALL